ncbi:MAG: hypothetical protein SOX64_07135 [Treponema sp.]|nr:hypothetical protein [Spirochaetia bacterium]MDY4211177.1 hypothetical protein [Treponema sp.]
MKESCRLLQKKSVVKKFKSFFAVLFVSSAVFNSCMTMADLDYSSIDEAVSQSDYAAVSEILEKQQKYFYSKRDKVLLYIDQGIVKHFASDYEASNKNLSLAEKEIELNFTKSVTQKIGQAVINDTVADYTGETYEDIYSNIFMCLNYIHLNKLEDAMVEIRRFDNKMKVIGSEYQDLINQQKANLKSEYDYSDFDNLDTDVEFHNSAFARYLSMLLYRADNDLYSAQIDYNKIQEAFALQKSVYDFSMPQELKDELSVPLDKARVNFICYTGRSPIKVEDTLRIPFNDAYYKLALPVLKIFPSHIRAIQVVMTDKYTGIVYKQNLSALEKISNIVCDTYKQHFGAIYARSLIRSISKSVTSGVLDAASRETSDSYLGSIFGILNLFSQVTTEVTERADVRICRFFPSVVSVAGISVPDGIYDIKINYYNMKKKIVHTDCIDGFEIKAGKLNLIESIYQH